MSSPTLPLSPKQLDIADAALRIIGKQGIAALTTATLAAELGVSQGAPFRHFANRDEILEAVALRVEELILETIPDRACEPLQRIKGLFEARAKAIGRHAGIARLMFSEQFALALPRSASTRLRNLVLRTRAYLLEALQEAMARGELRSDLPAETLLPIVMGTLQNLVLSRSLGQGKESDVETLSNTLLTLLAPPPARR
ncbi:MAG: TetR/AcrR family transcriptional regulator [Acidobacteria bacterium]|nr:TetR/AcrR family transcriptional regulator [Acidobacteriota bacterium]